MKFILKQDDNEMNVALRGDINEDAEQALKDLLLKIVNRPLIFDLEHIGFVNSRGAVSWYQFHKEITAKVPSITYKKCSIAFVESCNIYRKFVSDTAIASLYVPVHCESCSSEATVLCDANLLKLNQEIPATLCTDCKTPMSPQVDLTEYTQCLHEA